MPTSTWMPSAVRPGAHRGTHPPARERIEAFRDFASRLPETLDVFVVTGPEDFLIHVGVPDTDALYAFVIDRLTGRPEVADVRTSIVFEHLRRSILEPLPIGRRGRDNRRTTAPHWPPPGRPGLGRRYVGLGRGMRGLDASRVDETCRSGAIRRVAGVRANQYGGLPGLVLRMASYRPWLIICLR